MWLLHFITAPFSLLINGEQHKNATVTNLRKAIGASGLGIIAA